MDEQYTAVVQSDNTTAPYLAQRQEPDELPRRAPRRPRGPCVDLFVVFGLYRPRLLEGGLHQRRRRGRRERRRRPRTGESGGGVEGGISPRARIRRIGPDRYYVPSVGA